MFSRLAHFATTRRRWVLAGSVAVLLGFLALAGGTFSALKAGGFDDPASGSSKARTILDDNFGGSPNLLLLVTPDNGASLTSPADGRRRRPGDRPAPAGPGRGQRDVLVERPAGQPARRGRPVRADRRARPG